jgi:hypothetical protein
MSNNRSVIDSVSPATMIISMVGYIVGLAGMALLGFGSLCFMKILIDAILAAIPAVVVGQNPLLSLQKDFSLQAVLYHFIFIAIGIVLRKLSSYMCAQETIRAVDRFFYRQHSE